MAERIGELPGFRIEVADDHALLTIRDRLGVELASSFLDAAEAETLRDLLAIAIERMKAGEAQAN